METLYIILIAMLFILAIFDLIVGVSNDAVNFLNSAVGSRAFNFKWLLALASVGIFIGATFSNGMMDITRHGIFQPEHYYFTEIITILIAVMLTDVVLLDRFNSLGMPTSTTVSLVFELLGASVAIAALKIYKSSGEFSFGQLLNTDKALSVILGIFLSVAIAFSIGYLVQYISRLVFSFGYKKNLRYFIGIFSSFSLTSIVYFILVKGLKNAAFFPKSLQDWVASNEAFLLLIMLGGFFVISQLLHIIGVNMLKVIIACGTFSLALAFAGNDLVNFIGIPLTGLSSLQHLLLDGGNPETFKMVALTKSESGQWYLLLLAGVVMVIALLTSKKAHKVIQTSVSLSSQNETDEIFGTNPLARAIIRGVHAVSRQINAICPKKFSDWMDSRFCTQEIILEKEDAAFDLIRASINLMLASSLIALGTSLKLPLSTTYVTFMVAMGSSLADRAWNRETAVYRISGVLSVIGGWFFTAFAAFASCFVVAFLLHFGKMPAIFILFVAVIIFLIHSSINFKKKEKQAKNTSDRFSNILKATPDTNVFPMIQEYSREEWNNVLLFSKECYSGILHGFVEENLVELRNSKKQLKILKKYIEKVRRQGTHCSRKMKQEDILVKNFFLYQANDFLGDSIFDIEQICVPCLHHVDNHFPGLAQNKRDTLKKLSEKISTTVESCASMISKNEFENYESIIQNIRETANEIIQERKREMTLPTNSENIRSEIIYLTILYESKSYLDAIRHLAKAARKFLTEKPKT